MHLYEPDAAAAPDGELAALRAQLTRASTLHAITARLAAATEQAAVVELAIAGARELFGASSAAVHHEVQPLAGPQVGPIADAVARRAPIWRSNVAALPLLHDGHVLGALAMAWDAEPALDPAAFDHSSAFATHLAIALWRTRVRPAPVPPIAEARSVEELTELLRLNELFTGVLAHDLRNPLGAITTAAELVILRAEQAGGETKPAQRILASARRMANLVDQLLDFTRMRLGSGVPLDPQAANLDTVLQEVVDELADARGDRIVDVEVHGDPCGTWDADRLAQVFSNLVANALHHGEPEHPVRVRLDGRDRDAVRVQVHNRGAIPPALLPRLFTPMVGADRRRDGSRGLGLGLFITHAITRRHGGSIDVVSDAERGTTFEVTLPRHAPAAVTERRPAIAVREPAPSRERGLVDTIRDYAIALLDPEGRVLSWNKGAELAKGYRADEVLGKHISVFYTPEDRQRDTARQLLQRALTDGHAEDEAWRVRKDGTRFWANVVITALRDEHGVHTGFAKITRDLTERKKLEEERLRLAEANEGIRLRDEFLSIVSHELKTPLTGLQLQLDLLSEILAGTDPRTREKLARAMTSSERLTHLIESLLDVSRIATGRFVLSLDHFDIVGVVAEVIDSFRSMAARSGTSIALVSDGPICGSWDRVRINQVVTNLLSNALKYGVGKPIDVRVENDDDGDEVVLIVRDHGPGIALEDRERIFGRFERASSARHFGGLGIGLYVVKEIVTAHGGTVMASNAPDGGACLTVCLPCNPALPGSEGGADG